MSGDAALSGLAAEHFHALRERVLQAVRELAQEVGGARAVGAVSSRASLEREVGLGSLERVELLVRLEASLGRTLDERFLELDTAEDWTRALLRSDAPVAAPPVSAGAPPPPVEAARPLSSLPSTIHGALHSRAATDPERIQVYLREDDGSELSVSYGRLWDEARAVAGGLRERGVQHGDRVALMLPTSLDFLRGFLGILTLGAVPVPIYPPVRLDRLKQYALRHAAILNNAAARLMITVSRGRAVADLLRAAVPTLKEVCTAGELAKEGVPLTAAGGSGADPAFIQYTSGSTGQPKGVLLTHDNLTANIRAIEAGLAARPTDVAVSWLPLYHDMGLIGSWLFCLVQGYPIDIQSPLSFLARPERWLWAIHRRRATLSAAPNFAYELCVRRIRDEALAGLDLSSWRCALNGAEPVQPETLERFVRRFEPYGFRREALLPVYGLAENSVALCIPPPGRGPRVDRVKRGVFENDRRALPAAGEDPGALGFVNVGPALPEHEVRVVDEQGAVLPERHVGRLAFRGPSMTGGYYQQPEATAAMTLPGGYYDSGDLGYLAEGEVHVVGRLKDLIIKGGRNLVPQEIEEVASEVPGVRKGCVAAFGSASASQGTESLVVVAETRVRSSQERDALSTAIVERVAEALGVPPDVVVMAAPGAVPKTSSGKIRRSDCKKLYERGQLEPRRGSSLLVRLQLGLRIFASHARRLAVGVGRGTYALWAGTLLAVAVAIAWALVALVPSRRLARFVARHGSHMVLLAAGCRMRLEGQAHLRGGGPWLLACNHTSFADIPVLLALLPLDVAFISKKEAATWPFVGLFLRRMQHLTVDRQDARDSLAAAERLADTLQEGRSVLVFPEATFTAAAGLRPFRLGAFKTAVETGTPVAPVALQGTRRLLRDKTWIPRPGRVGVWIGEPIAPQGGDWKAIVELRDRVASAIAAHCEEPRLDLVAAGLERPQA